MTLSLKILSGLYLRNHKMQEVDTWLGHWLEGCGCATSCCDIDVMFDLAVVTLTFDILSGLYLRNCKA